MLSISRNNCFFRALDMGVEESLNLRCGVKLNSSPASLDVPVELLFDGEDRYCDDRWLRFGVL